MPERVDEPDFGGLPLDYFLPRFIEYDNQGTLPDAGGYDDQPVAWWQAVRDMRRMIARAIWEQEHPELAYYDNLLVNRGRSAFDDLRKAPSLQDWM